MPEFEIIYCGKTMVRVTRVDEQMWVETWIPVPGAPADSRWLGYTGPMHLAHYVSVDSFDASGEESS